MEAGMVHTSARALGAPRWRTRFGSWVRDYSIARLLRDLEAVEGFAITRSAVQEWLAGRSSPALRRAHALVRLSAGALTMDDVYAHRDELARLAARPETCDGDSGHGPRAARRAR